MIEMQPSVVLLLVEAVALLALVQVVWLVLAWLRRRRVNTAVAALIEAVGSDADARGERNGSVIGTALGADGEALETHVKAVERATRIVLQRVVVGWSRHDAQSIAGLPEALEGLSTQWRELLGAGGQAVSAPVDEVVVQKHVTEVANLTEEKRALAEEVAITRNTMDRMLNEYAAIYERGDQEGDSTAKRLLNGELDIAAPPEADTAHDESAAAAEEAGSDDATNATETPVATGPVTAEVAVSTSTAATDTGTSDDDVTEDDLDALFDAHAVRGAGDAEDDVMLADLDVEDPFDGLDDEAPMMAELGDPAAGEEPAAKTAAAS